MVVILGYGSYFGYLSFMEKINKMYKVIWLIGYKSQQDIPSLSETFGYGNYFGYLGYMVKKGINCVKVFGYQGTILNKISLR